MCISILNILNTVHEYIVVGSRHYPTVQYPTQGHHDTLPGSKTRRRAAPAPLIFRALSVGLFRAVVVERARCGRTERFCAVVPSGSGAGGGGRERGERGLSEEGVSVWHMIIATYEYCTVLCTVPGYSGGSKVIFWSASGPIRNR